MFEEAVGKKEIQKDQVKKYPGCNSQFKTGEGGKVWCGDETLVPRKVRPQSAAELVSPPAS